jgi:hypothetical protein
MMRAEFEGAIMTKRYPAVLRGGQIEWIGEAPPASRDGRAVRVEVQLLATMESLTPEERRKRMVEALEKLAAGGRIEDLIPDPVAWQREERKDRPLPGRDDLP